MTVSHPFILGLAAGLGIAVPLGAVGILIVLEGVDRGLAPALGAACGVACVDTIYATAATVVGTTVAPLIARLGTAPALFGGSALVASAWWQASGARSASVAVDQRSPGRDSRGPIRSFLVFTALTAVNPATVLYFAALIVPLSDALTVSSAVRFVAGIGVGSAAWQSVLAIAGTTAGTRLSQRGRRTTIVIGNLIVGILGVTLILSSLR